MDKIGRKRRKKNCIAPNKLVYTSIVLAYKNVQFRKPLMFDILITLDGLSDI